jgi:hypothetical protein
LTYINALRWKGYSAEDIENIMACWGGDWIRAGIDEEQIREMQLIYDKVFELTDFFKTRPDAAEFMKMT